MKTQNMQRGILIASALSLAVLVLGSMPHHTYAANDSASLGGGNALTRALAGRSLGLTNATSSSSILVRLEFASGNGGQPDPLPSEENANDNSNTGGNASTEQSDGENGADASSAGGAGGAGGNNGGTTAGNGGNGGNGGGADTGGLVRAGNVVSNSTAVNMLNTIILRIGH
jgi:hypothetical protein